VNEKVGILPTNRYLLIFDGHNLYVTVDVVAMVRETWLDLLTLLSHTFHAL
jgi:hypothetical protein